MGLARPLLCLGLCRTRHGRRFHPSARTQNVIPEQDPYLGDSRRRASISAPTLLIGFSGTDVIIAAGTSVHKPSPPPIGSGTPTSWRRFSIVSSEAPVYARSVVSSASHTAPCNAKPSVLAATAYSFTNSSVPGRPQTNRSSSMVFGPSSTASTGHST